MLQNISDWLLLAALTAPPAAVILAGLLLLAPRFKQTGTVVAARCSHAHV